jgi:phosphatidylserine/phosphatidylglycerophosphate/cardiolipin synthase-like enzyme
MEYLDAVEAELKSVSPGMKGTLWDRTSGNMLDPANSKNDASWILQVPGNWGRQPASDLPEGVEKPGIRVLLDKVRRNISEAKSTVDITGFGPPSVIGSPAGPFPDGQFLDAMCDGLKNAAAGKSKDDSRLIVRFMTGVLGGDFTADPWAFREALIKMLGKAADAIELRVASMATRGVTSYNHTKFVIVDGASVIHGGINWMTNYYIEEGPFASRGYGDTAPVTDLDIALRGPAAASAGRFLDMLWDWARGNAAWIRIRFPRQPAWIAVEKPNPSSGWLLYENVTPPAPGKLDVITVGSLGYGIQQRDEKSDYKPPPAAHMEQAATLLNNETNTDRDFMTVNPDANAMRALISQAKANIVLSQMDINGLTTVPFRHPLFDVRFLDVLAAKMSKGVKVRIVISNPGSPDYSNISSMDVAYKSLYDRVRLTTTYDAEAHCVLRRNLQLAPFRASTEHTWPGDYKYRLHTKLVCVDDTAFYVGSRNVYPDTTQDHGFIIESKDAAAQLDRDFLAKQWDYSRNAAICDYNW